MRPEAFYLLYALLAAALSLVIGLEREYFSKQAGIRTHTLVGLGAAVFTIVSKYGFIDVAAETGGTTDGARVAAQVVTGIGFLGAGLIFVRRDSVHGLTTAASIWLVAAVGMAAGSGMWLIAVGVTVIYLLVTMGIRPLARRMPHAPSTYQTLRITYEDGHGVLRRVLEAIGSHGLVVGDTEVIDPPIDRPDDGSRTVVIHVQGTNDLIDAVVPTLDNVPWVRHLTRGRQDETES